MSWALLFPGQGAQHPAMLPWVDAGAPLEALLGVPSWRQALEDPAWASRNRNAQLLLTGVALSAWRSLAPHLPPPDAVAGYSVGELAAFSAAGVFDGDTAVALAAARASTMDRCADDAPGGLLAVGGVATEVVEAWCAGTGASVAIHIDRDSVVVGGPLHALDAVAAAATARGVRCTRLPVAVASHTPAMQAAAAAFGEQLATQVLRPPAVALVANATGARVLGAAEAGRALAAQVAAPVRWSDCLEAVHDRRVACVLELGPGRALATHWSRRFPDVPARSADEFRSLDAVVDWVRRHADDRGG